MNYPSNKNQKFAEAVKEAISSIPIIDSENFSELVNESDETIVGIASIKLVDFNLLYTVDQNDRDCFITITNGPIEDVGCLLEYLAMGGLGDKHNIGDLILLNSYLSEGFGIKGLYIYRPNIYGLFEDFQESFVYESKEISIKSVLFLNAKEVELFKDNTQLFFEELTQKDLVKFDQNG